MHDLKVQIWASVTSAVAGTLTKPGNSNPHTFPKEFLHNWATVSFSHRTTIYEVMSLPYLTTSYMIRVSHFTLPLPSAISSVQYQEIIMHKIHTHFIPSVYWLQGTTTRATPAFNVFLGFVQWPWKKYLEWKIHCSFSTTILLNCAVFTQQTNSGCKMLQLVN